MPNANAATSAAPLDSLADRYRATRTLTSGLLDQLSEADATLQSMEDASPAKWHLGHTNWFFETFLLRDHKPGYELYDERWPFVFNSYYEAEGVRIARFSRGMLSRPTVEQIGEWREVIDEAMSSMLDDPRFAPLIELGIAHEQQHQELLLTDIKHALFRNPLAPAMYENAPSRVAPPQARDWHQHPGGIALIGHDGANMDGDFAYDNEGPQHQVLLTPFALAPNLVTNAEWQQFVDDGGYANPLLWLSDGWAWVNREKIAAPLYWYEDEQFTHTGWTKRDPNAPVTHISYFEADAFATWAGQRLPTEFEWEAAAQSSDPASGNQLDGAHAPLPLGGSGLFGDCWQFTRSAYGPYPRFSCANGAIGEYNGKFMSGQFVLRGASCATPRGHSRSTYRNFFYPHQRWQFTGLRLAKDI
ncbi:ergothioneine biosynthesis protein EgtB [Pontixanthobacter aestiaquae]|uniref:Ergothioneine biosynthesis protein EgtB n=1 Tax=Pontixanthobacter aestiaquae TaxID=1509367 RepID=A0A844Z7Z1_9SPHN|nr:ergothioneine biosynthesis protein EgtB [Pontixanthobacter aestiaquae]MDN3644974.1 ergothioneine biosynthesis protein EgtB [Pontixanthobacter aestiaquae]MXO84025.1 ergothioneine biosynthesis protein EgtB [Pontixanthobacter aestiaquae]